jgi:hypothetical protein
VQTVSADLAAAILAQERTPLVRLRVDWDRDGSFSDADSDLSGDVVSVDLSRDLTTDLPAAAKLFSGAAAAEATVTLAHRDPGGDGAKHGAWYYSPLNSASPLYAYKRKGAPAILELGFATASGNEYVTVLTGRVRSLQVTSGGRVAVMRISDGSEDMRRQVTLPMVIADGDLTGATAIKRPGLNTTFLADWVARACGYYASPPMRSNCALSVTHHGSGYPELGAVQHHEGANGSKLAYSPTPDFPTAAKWVQAVNTDGSSGQEITYVMSLDGGTVDTNNGGEFLWEGWRKFNTVGVDQPLFICYVTGQAEPYISAFWQQSTGRFAVTFSRAVADTEHSTGTSGPSVSPGTSSWHYWAVQLGFNSTGVDVTFRYDSTTTGPVNIATSSFTGQPDLNTFGVARGKISAFSDAYFNGLSEADQVTTESTTSTWNNAFVPTADIHASSQIDNRLVATPPATEEGWSLFQQIAAAEFATAGFTELGKLFYWPRDRWTQAPYTTSQRTLSSTTALKELESVEAIDQVRNRVVIRAKVPEVLDSQTVWKLGSRVKLTASQTKVIWINLDEPVANVDTSFVYGGPLATGSSRYLAADRLDGQGAQVTTGVNFAVDVLSPTSIKLTVTNTTGGTVYLVADENASATQAGKPMCWLDAQLVRFGQETTGSHERAEATDATSITNYGEQLLEIEDSDFRQSSDDIQVIADDLVADLAEPGPALSDVPAVGDPRIQLGDRLTIVDPDGLAMSADYHVSAVSLEFSGDGGLGMVLSLRSA